MKQIAMNLCRTSVIMAICAIGTTPAFSAARQATVVSKASQVGTSLSAGAAVAKTDTSANVIATTPTPAPAAARQGAVVNKASQFETSLSAGAAVAATDMSANALADRIREQRATLDSASTASAVAATMATMTSTGNPNTCDANLRACMQQKCGGDFTKCAGDGDTIWGDKMDACRRDLRCTGEEYRLFATEIKADRDMNARLASYNAVLDCGNRYNDCIVTQCGVTYSRCLGKTAGDKAISSCDKIAKECAARDSGLAARTMEVFATLRQSAEVQVKEDEQRLYALRDKMRDVCGRLGAMFDERSLDCVYTVEFYAGDASTLFASKKTYAGGTFDCTPNWFGIDVTTFMENAYRLTRSQTSATSALLGAGVGTAVGTVTSGMLNRALDTQKAKKALDEAKDDANTADSNRAKTEERCRARNDGKTSVKKNVLGMWVCYDPNTNAEDESSAADREAAQRKAQERCDEKGSGKEAKKVLGVWVCRDIKTSKVQNISNNSNNNNVIVQERNGQDGSQEPGGSNQQVIEGAAPEVTEGSGEQTLAPEVDDSGKQE